MWPSESKSAERTILRPIKSSEICGFERKTAFENQRRQPRIETITWIRLGSSIRFFCPRGDAGSLRVASGQPDGFGVARHRRGRKRQVSEDSADSGATRFLARVSKCFSRGMQQPLEERIQSQHLFCGDCEPARIEVLFEPLHVAAAIRPRAIHAGRAGSEHAIGCYSPATGRGGAKHVLPCPDEFPELLGAQRPRQHACATNDRNRIERPR